MKFISALIILLVSSSAFGSWDPYRIVHRDLDVPGTSILSTKLTNSPVSEEDDYPVMTYKPLWGNDVYRVQLLDMIYKTTIYGTV